MREGLIKRKLQVKEIQDVVNLVTTSFNPDYLIPSIYRTKGIKSFINSEIKNPYSPFEYYVLSNRKKELLAFAEFKIFNTKAFLNIIATSLTYKNKGFSTILFNKCFQDLSIRGYSTVELDVFRSNSVAINWYSNLGFEETESYQMFIGDLSHSKNDLDFIQIANYPQFCLLFNKLGFAYLEINLNNESVKIGVIKEAFIVRNIYSEELMNLLNIISDKLGIKYVYFILKKDNYPKIKKIDTIVRMKIIK
jgi:ribosomal protein S18 acetylase RimI-like enzyme